MIRRVVGQAAGAKAPVDDFSLVDAETVVTRCCHAGRISDGAIDIGDGTAGTADDVVVVVTDPGLVTRYRAGWLDVSHESGVAERPQSVVDGLVGDLAEVVPDGTDYRVRVGVGMVVDRAQHGHPGTGDTQSVPAQQALAIKGRRHKRDNTLFWNHSRLRPATLSVSQWRGPRSQVCDLPRPGPPSQ